MILIEKLINKLKIKFYNSYIVKKYGSYKNHQRIKAFSKTLPGVIHVKYESFYGTIVMFGYHKKAKYYSIYFESGWTGYKVQINNKYIGYKYKSLEETAFDIHKDLEENYGN